MSARRPTSIRQRLFDILIRPHQTEVSARNREYVFNIVVVGTGAFLAALTLLLLQSYLAHNHHVLGRLFIVVASLLFIAMLHVLSRRWHKVSAYLLAGLYVVLASGSVAAWGIGTPFGIILLALVIILAGTVLSSRHALYAAYLVSAIVIIVQIVHQTGWLVSDLKASNNPAQLGDAIGLSVVFGILGTISWLFGRETERSLSRAETAEVALEREKTSLKARVAERTAELKKSQVEELRQLHQFAEVGQLSTGLLHELANNLSVLTLEIEAIHSKRHSDQLDRSRQIVSQLNAMLNIVRDRLASGKVTTRFNVLDIINKVVMYVGIKDINKQITIDWQPSSDSKNYILTGDQIKFSQIIAIILDNALDACLSSLQSRPGKNSTIPQQPMIVISAQYQANMLHISIIDRGTGISARHRKRIFQPNFSTKKSGMGIGLYLAQQMVVSEFGGELSLSPTTEYTQFTITIPKKYQRN